MIKDTTSNSLFELTISNFDQFHSDEIPLLYVTVSKPEKDLL
jgi:hypothetical protein